MLTNKFKLLVIPLLLTGFIGFYPFSLTTELILLFVFLFFYRKELRSGIFNKYIYITFIGILFSSISCYLYRKQPIYLTIGISFNYLSIATYFIFKSKHFKLNEIVDAMDMLGKIVTILYLLRFVLLQRGIVIGGYVDEFQMADVGSARIRIACSPIIFFLMFKSFHNLLIAKKKKDAVWLVLTILCMVLMTFRTIFVVVGISFIIILFRANLPAEKKVISAILISIICSGVFMNDKVSERITNRFEESAGQDFSNKDYIRVVQYEYFTQKHFKNEIEHFFGSGIPEQRTAYGKEQNDLAKVGIFYVDWGIIGMSWMLGVITLIGMIGYMLTAIKKSWKMEPYIPMWLIYMLLVSVTTGEFIRDGSFIVQALVLALIIKKGEGNENRNIDISSCK